MEESPQHNHYYLPQSHPVSFNPMLMESFPAFVMAHAAYYNPQQIEHMVELEMARIKENWSQSEQQYVEQSVLEEDPIARSSNTNQQQQEEVDATSEDEEIDVVSLTTEVKHDAKQQRAPACRNLRPNNNKIRKAKSKYRYKYMSLKLQSTTQLLDNILDVVDQAERQLLSRGFSRDSLQHLRNGFRVDAALHSIQSLEHTMEM